MVFNFKSLHRLIGFDFGKKRIGIATGCIHTKTAQGICTIQSNSGNPNWRKIETVINDWNPYLLVVGLPINMDGTESTMSIASRRFGRQLKDKTGIKVVFVDERLSTLAADFMLMEIFSNGKSVLKRRKKFMDSLAAGLILHTYIEQEIRIGDDVN